MPELHFNEFGPKQDPQSQYTAVVPIFIKKAIENKPITIYGNGKQTRDFIFVKDVVKANVLAAVSNCTKGVFNVALGRTTTINELAKNIIKITKSNSIIVYENGRTGDIKDSLAAIEKTVDILIFKPKYTLSDGLEETVNSLSTISV